MTVREAFCLSPIEWDKIESEYEALLHKTPEEMIVALLSGATFDQKKALALGIMVGRSSMQGGKHES